MNKAQVMAVNIKAGKAENIRETNKFRERMAASVVFVGESGGIGKL